MTAGYPDDLEIRAQRAAVHRRIGNVVEAGRWGFLTEEVWPAEVAAFERAFPKPWLRLHALKLRAEPGDTLGPGARRRFAGLIEQVERENATRVTWTEDGPSPETSWSWSDRLSCLIAVLVVVVVVGLIIIGLFTVIRLAI